MPIDRRWEALKFFDSVIEDHGYNPDDVVSVLAIFRNMPSMEDVSLRIDAKTNDGPYTALGIYAVDTDARYRPKRMTNSVDEAATRNTGATEYIRRLSTRIGRQLTVPHGYVGDRQGYAHMGDDYLVVESGLLLPRGGAIDLTITMPFAETARSEPAAAR